MVTKDELLEVLPVRDQTLLVEDRQNTDDIRELILVKHKQYAADYDLISHYFNTGNIVDTSRQIFEFLKNNVPYKKENGKYQTIKSPALILMADDPDNGLNDNLNRVDCKNYASFIAGLIDSIKRQDGGSWSWCYRFASYDENQPEPGHVFVVVKINGKELWIDPVFTFFNAGDMHEWELDETPSIGGLYSISGPADVPQSKVIVNTKDAATNWLVAVQLRLFGLSDLLLRYPQVTNSPQFLKALADSGVSIDALRAILTYINNN